MDAVYITLRGLSQLQSSELAGAQSVYCLLKLGNVIQCSKLMAPSTQVELAESFGFVPPFTGSDLIVEVYAKVSGAADKMLGRGSTSLDTLKQHIGKPIAFRLFSASGSQSGMAHLSASYSTAPAAETTLGDPTPSSSSAQASQPSTRAPLVSGYPTQQQSYPPQPQSYPPQQQSYPPPQQPYPPQPYQQQQQARNYYPPPQPQYYPPPPPVYQSYAAPVPYPVLTPAPVPYPVPVPYAVPTYGVPAPVVHHTTYIERDCYGSSYGGGDMLLAGGMGFMTGMLVGEAISGPDIIIL